MLKVFAVYDIKAASYGTPMFLQTQGLAMRAFSDAVKDPGSILSRHPGDYRLDELGEYEPNSGMLKGHALPVFVVSAASLVAAARLELEKREPLLPAFDLKEQEKVAAAEGL